jgi:hypothetical protein
VTPIRIGQIWQTLEQFTWLRIDAIQVQEDRSTHYYVTTTDLLSRVQRGRQLTWGSVHEQDGTLVIPGVANLTMIVCLSVCLYDPHAA